MNGSGLRPALLAHLKALIAGQRKLAEEALLQSGRGTACAKELSHLQDNLIAALHGFAATQVYPAVNPTASERLSVIAVGGYGRGTLAPGSDIDLLFILPYKQTAWGESVVEYLLYMLWDMGFKVGHSSRSVDDCIRLAKTDSTILTSILEARFICGDTGLYEDMTARFAKEVVAGNEKEFIAAKLAERDDRHRASGESRYVVEPDVKDGKGGQRDLHTLFWIAKFAYNTQSIRDLEKARVFSKKEMQLFARCEDFLWAVRCHMHFMTGRADDRLGFDKQSEMAARLGYTARDGMKHVERFMKHYFLIAKDVGSLTRILCAVLEANAMKNAPAMSRFFERLRQVRPARALKAYSQFKIDAGRLNMAGDDVLGDDPVNFLRLFGLADRHNLSIHPDALRLVHRNLSAIGKPLRKDADANRIFMELLCDSSDPEAILRILNEAGVLGRFIPDFGRIVALMQFNMYHHYTVDEHLLRAIGVLAEIEKGTQDEEHPLASEIIGSLKNIRALYVAVLLHDVAKGRKEDHSIAGERVARKLCPRLGLSAAETELVAWLVRNHLIMSETAQMRDLNDYKTILDFAAIVQSPERLKLLLILTVVDIRAVGPGVWNGWKGQLLRTLYYETEPVLSGGHTAISRDARVAAAKAEFTAGLAALDWHEDQIAGHVALHYDPYWLTADTGHQLAHARLIERARSKGEDIATAVTTDQFTAITELTVYAPDHPRLLALMTGACAAAGADIAGAQIFTTSDGMALDTLLIQREFSEASDEQRRAGRIAGLIAQALRGQVRLRDLIKPKAAGKGRLKAFTIEPVAIIDNQSSNRLTVIEVNGLDRTGLLFDLTQCLFALNLNIASAHITTFGEKAVDVFYVTDLTGGKITNAERRHSIQQHLLDVLSPGRARKAGPAKKKRAADKPPASKSVA